MKPASLLSVLLELLVDLTRPGPYPADARVGRFFRQRRFLGSHDRRFLADAAYSWLRHHNRGRARWRAWGLVQGSILADLAHEAAGLTGDVDYTPPQEPGHDGVEVPSLVLLLDILALARDQLLSWTFDEALQAAAELPANRVAVRTGLLDELRERGFRESDAWPLDPLEAFAAKASLPRWLAWRLIEERGEDAARKLALALAEPASLDLRVNLRLVERERARKKLHEEISVEVEPTHFSPLGLRLESRRNLTGTFANRENWIEVQDEGSQLVVLCLEPEAGRTVIDACAGSGGKTLALADILLRAEDAAADLALGPARPQRSRVLACDIAPERLHELRRRASEAGVAERIDSAVIAEDGPLAAVLPQADLVLVDAPCSGLGTLRRNPELKLRYGPRHVAEFHVRQLAILDRFAPLVRPGGRLAYAACSFLRQECDAVADAFEAAHPEFAPSPSEWAARRLPAECLRGARIAMDPVSTKTDAFFLSLWRRSS
jgi:16S rRNA (cytosine967-C5)-methyltransferase